MLQEFRMKVDTQGFARPRSPAALLTTSGKLELLPQIP